jgi:hypothetical protein
VVAVDGQAPLASDEAEALAELQEERLEPVDDRLLQIALEPVPALLQLEELEHHGVLQDVARMPNTLAFLREGQNPILVPALCEPLVEQRPDLALELPRGPAFLGGLDLIEGARLPVLDTHEDEVVRP